MFILQRPMPEGMASFFASPAGVELLFAERDPDHEPWSTYVNDSSDLLTKGTSFNLDDGLARLLVAKDKDTLIRGFSYAGTNTLNVDCGSIVLFRGKYHTGSRTKKKKGNLSWVPERTPAVLKAILLNTIGGALKNNRTVSTKQIRNAVNHRLLEKRGYYTLIVRQSALSSMAVRGTTYVGRSQVTFQTISALLNHGKEIQAEGKFFLDDYETLLQKFRAWLSSGDAEKAVQEFEYQQRKV